MDIVSKTYLRRFADTRFIYRKALANATALKIVYNRIKDVP